MAVANKKGRTPKHYLLTLEDGQEVNVMAVRGGQTVGGERELVQVHREFTVIQGRIEHLTQEAIQAPDDKTYQSKLNYVKKFEKNFADLEPQIEKTLLLVLTEWDLALTEEDEKEAIFVPLTPEGLQTLERTIKFDVFGKLMDQFGEESEEKKGSSESSPDGIPVKANLENAQTGQSTTN